MTLVITYCAILVQLPLRCLTHPQWVWLSWKKKLKSTQHCHIGNSKKSISKVAGDGKSYQVEFS